MKVVLFCGGLGTRLQEFSETIPKPMVNIGFRPILWHLMRYYAHFGHKEFILCLGYRGEVIRDWFLKYNECLSSDFVMTEGGREIQLFQNDIEDWTIKFIDTGQKANIGERLLSARPYLDNDEIFLANYSDGLTDLDLQAYMENFYENDKTASFLCVRPSQSFHVVTTGDKNVVSKIQPVSESEVWINGGFFAFNRDIFNYIRSGEDLVEEPFQRLIAEDQLIGYRNSGFWACMDTYKEKKMFDEMYADDNMPWMVRERNAPKGT